MTANPVTFPRSPSWMLAIPIAALAACRIEPTPQSYIDHQTTPQEEVARSEEELRDRLALLVTAASDENGSAVTRLLDPAEDAYVIGPTAEDDAVGPRQVAALIARAAGETRLSGDTVALTVGPRNNYAWFRMDLAARSDSIAAPLLRFSGILRQIEGEWRLIQAHLASPTDAFNPPEAEAAPEQAP